MSDVKKITTGQVIAQVGNGTLTPYAAATKQASYAVEGKTLANLVYIIASKIFNMKKDYAPTLRVNGVVSGCEVTSATNDNISVAAGVVYINGAQVTVAEDLTNAVSRPATGKYAHYAVVASTAGAVSIEKGTDGDTLLATYGSSAGQIPLTATDVAVLAYFTAYSDTAGVIPQAQITEGESANVDYKWLPLHGGVRLFTALPLNKTGGVSRAVYIQYRDLLATGVCQAVAHILDDGAKLTITRPAPQDITSHDSTFQDFEPMPVIGWDFQLSKYQTDDFWAGEMLDPDAGIYLLKFKEDEDDTLWYYGFAVLNGSLIRSNKRGVPTEPLNFKGKGELRHAA